MTPPNEALQKPGVYSYFGLVACSRSRSCSCCKQATPASNALQAAPSTNKRTYHNFGPRFHLSSFHLLISPLQTKSAEIRLPLQSGVKVQNGGTVPGTRPILGGRFTTHQGYPDAPLLNLFWPKSQKYDACFPPSISLNIFCAHCMLLNGRFSQPFFSLHLPPPMYTYTPHVYTSRRL